MAASFYSINESLYGHTDDLPPIKSNKGEGLFMRRVELKKIGAGSAFQLCFTIGTVAGFVICLVFLITGSLLQNIGMELGTSLRSGGPLTIGAAVAGVLVGSLTYGLACGIVAAGGAFIYNLFAAAVGGIRIHIEMND